MYHNACSFPLSRLHDFPIRLKLSKPPGKGVWLQRGYDQHIIGRKDDRPRAASLCRVNEPVFFFGALDLAFGGRGVRGDDTKHFVCTDHISKSNIH